MSEKIILLVEDSENDVLLTERAFRKAGIANRVVMARNGAVALELLLGGPGQPPLAPTVVLLDLKLPKVDGLEVLRRMRNDARTRTIPVVVLTTSREEQDVVQSYQLGANSYVRKPVDFASFADAIAQLGLYWLVLNEGPPGARS